MATDDEILRQNRRTPVTRPVVQPAATAMASPQVSPLAAEINRQIARPGGVSPAADAVNSQIRAPGAPGPVQQPAYRTGAPVGQPQFQQTPAPVNPNPRAATVMAQQAPVAAAAPAPAPAPAAAANGLRRAGQVAAEAQSAVGAAARMGAAPVATAGPGIVPGLEKTAPGQRGGAGAFLATMAIPSALTSMNRPTAEYEQRLGLNDSSTPAGSVYTAARNSERDAESTIRKLVGDGYVAPPSTAETMARGVGVLQDLGAGILDTGLGVVNMVRAAGGAKPLETFESLNGIKPVGAPAGAAAEALPGSSARTMAATPQSGAGGTARPGVIMVDPDNPATQPPTRGSEVIGQFNGRNITRAQSDALAGQLNTVSGNQIATVPDSAMNRAQSAAQQMASFAQRSRGSGAVGAIIRADGQDEISKALRDIGPLDRRGRRQAAIELLGLRQRGEESAANRIATAENQQNELAQRAAGQALAAEVDMAQTEANTRNQRRQNTQTVTGSDGTTYSVEGSTLTPLRTSDGKVFKAATKADDSQARIAAGLLESLLPPGASPEQVAQATATARMAARGLTGDAPPPPNRQEWLKQAKAANKGVSEAELTAYYDRTYGTGK